MTLKRTVGVVMPIATGLAVGWWGMGLSYSAATPGGPAAEFLQQADQLFKDQHWAEARAAYDTARAHDTNWSAGEVRLAVEGAVACSVKLKQWDDAFHRAEEFISRTKATFEEAVGERFLGGLYLTVPHHGTKQGGNFLRGQWTQGVQVHCWRKDRRLAIEHYERARDLLQELEKQADQHDQPAEFKKLLGAERIGINFDLATALAQHRDHYYGYGGWCGWWWWVTGWDAKEDSEALEEADYEEPRWGWYGQQNQEPPTGIPLGEDGQPQFMNVPNAYTDRLGDGQKIRFLLDKIQRLDQSENKDDAAKALFRWAMIARSLYGPDSASQWSGYQVRYDRMGRALPPQPDPRAPQKKMWELADNEALTIAGGRLQVVQLPAGESPIHLLRLLEEQYPASAIRPEAHYARGLYYQTRQQFPEALREYREFLKRHPQHQRADSAQGQINRIRQPDVMLGQTGVYLPGSKPKLTFTYRNADAVQFKAFPIDLVKYVLDRMQDTDEHSWWSYRNINYDLFQQDRWTNYLGSVVAEWSEAVRREPEHRVAEADTLAPLDQPGAYLVEAMAPGENAPNRVLVLVTDIAIVQKNLVKKGLIYVCDARTGQPLPEKAVRVYEHWSTYNQTKQKSDLHWEATSLTTDTNGVIEYVRKHADRGSQVDAVVSGEAGRMAFSFFQRWTEIDPGYYVAETGPRHYVMTDRPVYRPGATVHFRVWTRQLQDRQYREPRADESVQLQIYDAKNNLVQELHLKTDAFGGVTGEYQLGDEPPLGVYHLRVNHYQPDARRNAGGLFRVEEYKKPEFAVNVQPAKTQARLGETVKARIEARYYFGAPVARGQVSYQVYRENYQHVYWGPGEYDWLYGKGYGRCYYAYPWFPWWGRWGCFICCDLPWPYWPGGWRGHFFPWGYYGDDDGWSRRYEGGTRKALRELVAQGETELKADGTCEIEIDTTRAQQELGDRDHRYTIEAEVRDASRRTIEGQGSIIVTRQEFYAFVETDGGWYQPQNEAHVEVRALTPDNVPVAAQGEVVVARIRYGGADNSAVQEEIVRRWPAETDAEGRLSFRYPIPGEGQYRITFKTQDSWQEEVQGNAVFWVHGPKFDGRVYRFNDLEVIADQRTYQLGDVAHLLVNTAESNSRLLFSDHVSRGVLLNYRFLDLPARSTVMDVRIGPQHVPNFFVEATLVRNGRVHTEARELLVPPVQGLLNVTLQTDQEVYRPGETGRVQVAVTDLSGEPVQGQVALAVYDKSVTYIQDEFGPNPRVFFHGQKRYHDPHVDSSLDHTFSQSGPFERPEHAVYVGGGEPEGWRGWWGLEAAGLSLSGGYGGYGGDNLGGRTSIRGDLFDYDARAKRSTSAVRNESAATDRMAGLASGGSGPMSRALASQEASALSLNQPMPAGKPVSATPSQPGLPDLVEPDIRVNFADTALWLPSLNLGADGKVSTNVVFPQSLTTWRVRGYALTRATQVGDATTEARTTKNLLVRLQSPRFFIERDEVVLSANVHNYLKTTKKVRAELVLPAELFEPLENGSSRREEAHPSQGNGSAPPRVGTHAEEFRLTAEATVPANGEHRFDWPVRVRQAGLARILVKALTDEESDGMMMAFPVLVHGINKTMSQSGCYRVTQDGERTLKMDLPADIDPEQTRLEVTLSPSLAGVMIDALPYLVGYPYGCVEQTMSRFYPSVLVADTLKKMGTNLETIGKQRRQMHEGDLKNRFGRYQDSPVFDSAELQRMVKAGLERIYGFQRNDGGWGWWREDDSSPYQSAYVLQGLHAAKQAGSRVDDGVYDRGLRFLQNSIQKELAKPKNEQQIGHVQTQAYLAYILSLEHRLNNDELKQWFNGLYEQRGDLNNYGRALLALALHNEKKTDEARTVLRNLLQFVDRDDANETAWIRTPQTYWWFWWNNDIEVNAWTLKALVTLDPQNDLGPRLVKWLLNNRRNGYYWRSTRDTALAIAAMTDYLRASGEAAPDYRLTVAVDGQPMKDITLTRTNFFTFDNRVVLYGLQVKPGPHQITLTKQGQGALYYSAYLSYFTKEEDVQGAGNEIFVERQYFRLAPVAETVRLPAAGAAKTRPAGRSEPLAGTGRTELRAGYTRVPLQTGDTVASGDKIEVVLKLTSKNTYDYLVFEDMKPAGCEPMELRSGGRWAGGLCANLELRDEKVVFFIGLLEQGQHILRYKLRAETPGHFHALPTSGWAMYAPEVKAISDEMRLKIRE